MIVTMSHSSLKSFSLVGCSAAFAVVIRMRNRQDQHKSKPNPKLHVHPKKLKTPLYKAIKSNKGLNADPAGSSGTPAPACRQARQRAWPKWRRQRSHGFQKSGGLRQVAFSFKTGFSVAYQK